MKKWIRTSSVLKKILCYTLAVTLLLTALPSLTAFAKGSGSANLQVSGNNVALTLNIPEGKTETITTLRLKMYVIVESGTTDEPIFTFADSIKSTVKDARVSQSSNGNYTIDIVISGKSDQDIFHDSESAAIGTLSLSPGTKKDFKAEIGLSSPDDGVSEDGIPVVEYVDSKGLSVQKVSLTNASPVIISRTATPEPSVTPKPTDGPEPSVTPEPSGTPAPTDTPTPTDTPAQAFNKTKVPKLVGTPKSGTNKLTVKWSKIAGASGYRIYSFNTTTRRYTCLKTITNPGTTSYKLTLEYGTRNYLKVRAFKINEDKTKTFGSLSKFLKVKIAPAKMTVPAGKSQKKGQATLSWKKVSGATGYVLYKSSTKNGPYQRVKVLKKTKTTYTETNLESGSTYYYKIRAYATGYNGKNIYGRPSSYRRIKIK